MKGYIALIIVLCSAGLASAASFNPDEIEWGANVSGTLYKGDTLTNGEYMVKAVEFTTPAEGTQIIVNKEKKIVPEEPVIPMVYLEIYKNNTLIRDIPFSLRSSTYIDPDYEIKVTATDFLPGTATEWVMEYYKPWAKISIQKRGIPGFEVTYKFTPDTSPHYNGDSFIANITLKNNGEAVAKNVDVDLDTGPLQLRSDQTTAHHKYYRIEKGASQSFEVTLAVPEMLPEQEFNLSLNEKFYDVKDMEYKGINSTLIKTSPRIINVYKSVKDRMYLKDTSMVRIVVSNSGTFEIHNIHVNDSLNENFELRSNTPLKWDIPFLKPGEDWSTTYSIKPLEASLSGFTIPTANASFPVGSKSYNVSSQTTTIVVNGPKIILTKTVNKQAVNTSELVTVNVNIKNVGDIGTRFEAIDPLPEDVSLAEGVTSITNWSEPNTVLGFSYTIRMNKAGKVELPATVAHYTNIEYKGTTRSVLSSEKPVIIVNDPSKPSKVSLAANEVSTPAPTPNTTVVIPGFSSLLTLGTLLLVAALRRN